MRRVLFLLFSVKAFAAPMVFNTHLTPASCTHILYHPKDRNIHRPYFSEQKLDRKSMISPIKAVGSGTFLYHPGTHELEFAIAYTNLSSPPVMVHLQIGYAHQDGPIIATLVGRPFEKQGGFSFKSKNKKKDPQVASKERSGFITGVIKLSKLGDLDSTGAPIKEEKMLIQGGCYITIHTHLNELGELRGQLTPLSAKQIKEK